MPGLQFHVRHIEDPNTDLDPADYFTVVPVDDSDFIIPGDPSQIYAFQWGTLEGDSDLHLFVYIDEKPFGQTILYSDIDQH